MCIRDSAKAVADLIEAAFPKMKGKVEINDIGTTIGSHTGDVYKRQIQSLSRMRMEM